MKIVTVVGARPQFIKAAPVSRAIQRYKQLVEVLVHTGQHYDDNMSDVFFRELELRKPDYRLGVGSGFHGTQTGEMLKRIEEVLIKECPECLLVYGDTNSTLAGALAAAKLHIPVVHVEAGLRSFNKRMPEEVNRLLTDHLSSLLFCPTETAVNNLAREGITQGVHWIGDVMYDAMLFNIRIAEKKSKILETIALKEPRTSNILPYYLATVHRAENTDNPDRLRSIVEAFQEISMTHPVIWPVHPRTRHALVPHRPSLITHHQVYLLDPLPYLDMLVLEKHAKAILTDSGGVQKEAFWLQVPCMTLRNETEWVETVESGWNVLAGTNEEKIINFALYGAQERQEPPRDVYGSGNAAGKVANALVSLCGSVK